MRNGFTLRVASSLTVAIGLLCSPAHASVVTALADGTIVPIPPAADGAGFNNAPVTVPDTIAPGITFTTDGQYSWFGFHSGFGFGGNGGWNSAQTPSIL